MESRAQQGALAAVEQEQQAAAVLTEPRREAPADRFAGPAGAQLLTFEVQERYLVERIEGAQVVIELKAIDDAHRVAGPDVLGAQVAMGIDDASLPDPRGQRRAMKGEKALLRGEDPSDGA